MIDAVYTIGVYGSTEGSFFSALTEAKIDLFLDVRSRRGMRGRSYSYANSTYLQNQLHTLGIEYQHLKFLAPSKELRQSQRRNDAQESILKSQRLTLSEEFTTGYIDTIKHHRNMERLLSVLETSHRPCFFCVERIPSACHRSIIALHLSQMFGVTLYHLMP